MMHNFLAASVLLLPIGAISLIKKFTWEALLGYLALGEEKHDLYTFHSVRWLLSSLVEFIVDHAFDILILLFYVRYKLGYFI